MRRGLCAAILASSAALGCVPSTEDLTPGGAAGFVVAPSAGSRGEPWRTSDGYTLTLERAAVCMRLVAGAPSDDDSRTNGYESVLFTPMSDEPVFAAGVSPGDVSLIMYPLNMPLGAHDQAPPFMQRAVEELWPRFLRAPDLAGPYASPDSQLGPSFLLRLRAAGERRDYRLDATMNLNSVGTIQRSGAIEVVENQLRTLPLAFRVECLFDDGFARFAAADHDGDGVLAPAELQAAPADALASSLAELLQLRTSCLMQF